MSCKQLITAARAHSPARRALLSCRLRRCLPAGHIGSTTRPAQAGATDSKAEIGFFLGSESGGKGIALRSVRAVLAYALASVQLNRIALPCAATNAPSMRLAG